MIVGTATLVVVAPACVGAESQGFDVQLKPDPRLRIPASR